MVAGFDLEQWLQAPFIRSANVNHVFKDFPNNQFYIVLTI